LKPFGSTPSENTQSAAELQRKLRGPKTAFDPIRSMLSSLHTETLHQRAFYRLRSSDTSLKTKGFHEEEDFRALQSMRRPFAAAKHMNANRSVLQVMQYTLSAQEIRRSVR
jgi:hypothetical protein